MCTGSGRLPYKNTSLSPDEQYSQMTLWSLAKSPLMFGGDATELDGFTASLLNNRRVLELNAHSTHNRQIAAGASSAVWAASGADGAVHVALFNRAPSPATLSTPLTSLGLSGTSDYDSLDLWTGARGVVTGGALSAEVAGRGVKLVRLELA